jgi:hypothetical protein
VLSALDRYVLLLIAQCLSVIYGVKVPVRDGRPTLALHVPNCEEVAAESTSAMAEGFVHGCYHSEHPFLGRNFSDVF